MALFLALSALATAVGYALFALDLADARARIAGRSTTIESSSGIIEYAIAGQGRPVLVIHGAAGGFDQSLDMTGALTRHDHRLIAPSRFGYLASTAKAELTVAGQASAYVDLLDHLGVDKVAIIAISAGAWSALEFASRFPDRCAALVLLVPAAALPPGTRNHGGAIARAMFESDVLAWAGLKATRLLPGLLDGLMLGTDASVVAAAPASEKARINELLDHLLPMRPRSAGMAFDIRTAAAPAPISLNRISCPVLAVSAEDDLFGTAARAREISASVPHGTTIVYPTGGHALIGHSDEALREITAFLSHHLPP